MGAIAKKLQRLRTRDNAGASRRKGSFPGGQRGGFAVFDGPLTVQRQRGPSSGSLICEGLTLYHDAKDGNFYWQQTQSNALQLTVYQFGGSYLSLAVAISPDQIAAMRQAGGLDVEKKIVSSRPMTAFVRLNVQVESRCEQMHQTFVVDRSTRSTRFDLDGLPGEHGPIENAWLDLIFSNPGMAEITLSSLTLNGAASG